MYLYRADICARVSEGVTLHCKKKKVYFESFVVLHFFILFIYLFHPQLLADPFIIYWPSSYLKRAADIDDVSK